MIISRTSCPQTNAAVYLNGLDTDKDAKKDEPKLKKDPKPAVSWQFGKIDKEQVWVKRTMPDGPTARGLDPKQLRRRLQAEVVARLSPKPVFGLPDPAATWVLRCLAREGFLVHTTRGEYIRRAAHP